MDKTVPQVDGGLSLRFTGSGSEYFRIWIVNLLLTLVTLGLYHPWAMVRQRRYFYGNTLLGDHAFDFHGNPKRMLRGYVLTAVLFVLFSVSSHFSPAAAAVALVAVAALWPALFRASQQFRMANTSWRGLRFRFTGGLGKAYIAFLPLLLAMLAAGAAPVLIPQSAATEASAAAVGEAGFSVMVLFLGVWLTLPLVLWLLKRYQHDHYGLGEHVTTLRVGASRFYGWAFKTGLLALAVILAAGVVLVAVAFVQTVLDPSGAGMDSEAASSGSGTDLVSTLAVLGGMVILCAAVQPYAASRLQNMVWSGTYTPAVQLRSQLRVGPMARLTLKNFVATVLTCGLYWPFAAVASARLRLESITVYLPQGVDHFAAQAGAAQSAAGEAAGDVFGIDFGL